MRVPLTSIPNLRKYAWRAVRLQGRYFPATLNNPNRP